GYGGQNAQIAPAISMLAAAMLHLTLDTSPGSAQAVQDRLDELATLALPRPDPEIEALLAHGRLLHDLLPAVDGTLKALFATRGEQDLEAARRLFADRHAVSVAAARRFHWLLYGTSLLLLAILVYLGLRLHAGALAARRRAAF